jgi:hypothetical protein
MLAHAASDFDGRLTLSAALSPITATFPVNETDPDRDVRRLLGAEAWD